MEARGRLHGPERLCWPAAWQLLRHPHPHTQHDDLRIFDSPAAYPNLRPVHDPICAFRNSADADISMSLLVLYASGLGPRGYSRHAN